MITPSSLNELLDQAIPHSGFDFRGGATSAKRLPFLTYISSAVFNEKILKHEDFNSIGALDTDGLFKTPFQTFRFCIESKKGASIAGIFERLDGGASMVFFYRSAIGERPLCSISSKIKFRKGELGAVESLCTHFESGRRVEYEFTIAKDGSSKFDAYMDRVYAKFGFDPLAPATQVGHQKMLAAHREMDVALKVEALSDDFLRDFTAHVPLAAFAVGDGGAFNGQAFSVMAIWSLNAVAVMCYDYLSPSNFVAKVTPAKPGKSVEWIMAREHYTIIHRHHPANSAKMVSGESVRDDDRHIQRIAHSRRAHTRVLRSERWGAKKGSVIPVRASWVGPAEWRDRAGQTYRIVSSS